MDALRRNILRYRTTEMMIFIYEAENLKRHIFGAIKNEKILNFTHPLEGKKGKAYYETAWSILIDKGILASSETAQLEQLFDYRNEIAHQIQNLICDLNPDYGCNVSYKYDYNAIHDLRKIKEKINSTIHKHFIINVDMDGALLEPLIKSLEKDLKRYAKAINKKFDVLSKENPQLHSL